MRSGDDRAFPNIANNDDCIKQSITEYYFGNAIAKNVIGAFASVALLLL
jgi:hypothetical protein